MFLGFVEEYTLLFILGVSLILYPMIFKNKNINALKLAFILPLFSPIFLALSQRYFYEINFSISFFLNIAFFLILIVWNYKYLFIDKNMSGNFRILNFISLLAFIINFFVNIFKSSFDFSSLSFLSIFYMLSLVLQYSCYIIHYKTKIWGLK